MNSPHHAENSAFIFGGKSSDYLSIHEIIDLNKTASFAVFGRFFMHHQDIGLAILEKIFTPNIVNSFAKEVPVKDILLQHLFEDYEDVPYFKHWLSSFRNGAIPQPVDEEMFKSLFSSDKVLSTLRIMDVERINAIFNLSAFTKDPGILSHPAKYCIFGHATGIHLAEKILGPRINGNWTNEVLVHYVNKIFHGIPTLLEYIDCVQKADWMLAPENDERKDPRNTQEKLNAYKINAKAELSSQKLVEDVKEYVKDPLKEESSLDKIFERFSEDMKDPVKAEEIRKRLEENSRNYKPPHEPGRCGGAGVYD